MKHESVLRLRFGKRPETWGVIEQGIASVERDGVDWAVVGAEGFVLDKYGARSIAEQVATAVRQAGRTVVW